MFRSLFLILGIYSSSIHAATFPLTLEHWAVPKSPESILQMPPLVKALDELNSQQGAKLILRYPGGDAGSLWVKELQSWLVSLGVPLNQMESVPGSTAENQIELEVVPVKKGK